MIETGNVTAKRVHGRDKLNLTSRKATVVYFATVEDFAKEDEPSWISTITNKISESGIHVDSVRFVKAMEKPVRAMLELLELPFELAYAEFCVTWLRDTLDPRLDAVGFEAARLPSYAKAKPVAFHKFQQAMNNNKVACAGLPDLSRY